MNVGVQGSGSKTSRGKDLWEVFLEVWRWKKQIKNNSDAQTWLLAIDEVVADTVRSHGTITDGWFRSYRAKSTCIRPGVTVRSHGTVARDRLRSIR